jgi:tRNA threonylcarbamoyl adenosine modification protein (Sua5/YciO/YrdC/YwlC family)
MEKGLERTVRDIGSFEAAEIIRKGGVAVLPTDTIYGLHASSANTKGVREVAELKGRGEDDSFLLLASDIEMADRLVSSWIYRSRELLEKVWPAPLTAILPAEKELGSYLKKNSKVAVRIPNYEWLRKLVERVGEPLVSTSVNRRSEPPLTSMESIIKEFDSLQLYVRGKEDRSPRPSTIIDFTEKPPLLLRQGAFNPDFITGPLNEG